MNFYSLILENNMINDNKPHSSDSNGINQKDLHQFMENVIVDLGGAASAVLVYVGISGDCIGPCQIQENR
jgi:hypothetical protein